MTAHIRFLTPHVRVDPPALPGLSVTIPTPREIQFPSLAERLAKLPTYQGATPIPYSLAERAVRLSSLMPPELRVFGLLAEAHKAFVGELAEPVRAALRQGRADRILTDLESRHAAAIHSAAGRTLPLLKHEADELARARELLGAAELRDLFGDTSVSCRVSRIRPCSWPEAAERWLSAMQLAAPGRI